MNKEIITHNELETRMIGQQIGQLVQPGTTIVLTGDLGTGKTTMSKGIAEGLGISQMIKSPTYTLIREYDEGRMPLYHMDVYRLNEGASDLGLEEYFEGDGLCLVEWGQMIAEELPKDYYEIMIDRLSDAERKVTVICHR